MGRDPKTELHTPSGTNGANNLHARKCGEQFPQIPPESPGFPRGNWGELGECADRAEISFSARQTYYVRYRACIERRNGSALRRYYQDGAPLVCTPTSRHLFVVGVPR